MVFFEGFGKQEECLQSVYEQVLYSTSVIALQQVLVAVLEQKEGKVSAKWCIDQTAFQPVVHLYFSSAGLVW